MLDVIVFNFCSGKQMFIIFQNISLNRCLFKPFHLLLMNTKIINQYRLTYTLCSDLNSLQVYVTEIKEQPIFKRIRWQTWALFECVFCKFAVPVVGCLTVAAGILARSEGVSKGTGTDQRFVKNALKNAELPPDSFKYWLFFYFCHIHEKLNYACYLTTRVL